MTNQSVSLKGTVPRPNAAPEPQLPAANPFVSPLPTPYDSLWLPQYSLHSPLCSLYLISRGKCSCWLQASSPISVQPRAPSAAGAGYTP